MYMPDCDDWPRRLPLACFAFKISKHLSTGYAPFTLIFGHKARVPSEFPPGETTTFIR